MYELIPRKTNQTARRLILLLFLGAAAVIVVTMLVPTVPVRWLFQLIAIGLLTGGVFLTTRYVTKLFIYRAEVGGDLTVSEANANGKRQITVCRVGLSSIRRRTLLDSPCAARAALDELKANKKKLFDYCVDLQPAESILLTVEEGGETFAIRLSFDPVFFELLSPTEPETEARGEAFE